LKERPFQALIIGTPLEFYREGLFSWYLYWLPCHTYGQRMSSRLQASEISYTSLHILLQSSRLNVVFCGRFPRRFPQGVFEHVANPGVFIDLRATSRV
jgi:hypothetical protein